MPNLDSLSCKIGIENQQAVPPDSAASYSSKESIRSGLECLTALTYLVSDMQHILQDFLSCVAKVSFRDHMFLGSIVCQRWCNVHLVSAAHLLEGLYLPALHVWPCECKLICHHMCCYEPPTQLSTPIAEDSLAIISCQANHHS